MIDMYIYNTIESDFTVTDYLFRCFLPVSLLYYKSSGTNMATVSHGDDVSNVAFLPQRLLPLSTIQYKLTSIQSIVHFTTMRVNG